MMKDPFCFFAVWNTFCMRRMFSCGCAYIEAVGQTSPGDGTRRRTSPADVQEKYSTNLSENQEKKVIFQKEMGCSQKASRKNGKRLIIRRMFLIPAYSLCRSVFL